MKDDKMKLAVNSCAADVTPNDAYKCGTLTYTKMGLMVLFISLLWGDFCYTLVETVVPTIMPLKLKGLDCPNWLMGVIISAMPATVNMFAHPIVSFKSDRFRSRWGRRIPFIITTMPFLCISLGLLGWSNEIQSFLQRNLPFLDSYAPNTVTIVLIAVFMVIFDFFNIFVVSLFFSLFNDVVPSQFIGRFIGLIRIVSNIASALYNFFIFEYATTHMREIFLGTAIIYFIGLGVMCILVKEGEYPPIDANKCEKPSKLASIKTFFRECFNHKIYWLIFAALAVLVISHGTNIFFVFFQQEMGLSLQQIGRLKAITGLVMILAVYFAATFVDRWHALRVTVYVYVCGIITTIMGWVWIFVSLPGDYYFWLCLGVNVVAAFQLALATATGFPLQARLFPKSRFAQFCSAQGVLRSFGTICSAAVAGLFIDGIKYFCARGNFAYRFSFVWTLIISVVAAVLLIKAYIVWYRLGGDAGYNAPASWEPGGFEAMPVVPTIGPQSRYMNIMLNLFNSLMIISLVAIPVLMAYMYSCRMMHAFNYFTYLLLPLALAAWGYWKYVEINIRRDVEHAKQGRPLHNGIPHHGILMVASIKHLLLVILWIVQVVITINLKMENEAIVFGLGNFVTNILIISSVWLFARIERGRLVTVDKALAD